MNSPRLASPAIRFAVGTPHAMQSSVWRVWNNGEELYAIATESRMIHKLSLHSSGITRLAYLAERDIHDPLINDSDPRVIYRWRQTDSFNDGWIRRLDILIPAVPISKCFSLGGMGDPNDIHWLETVSGGDKCQITLLVADSSSRDPMKASIEGDKFIGSLPMPSGRVAWLRSRTEAMSQEERQYAERFAHEMKVDYVSDPGQVFVALTMVGQASPIPLITNIALGWENVFVKGKPILLSEG